MENNEGLIENMEKAFKLKVCLEIRDFIGNIIDAKNVGLVELNASIVYNLDDIKKVVIWKK